MSTSKTYTYELPADNQRMEQDARTMAHKEVRDNYPGVYRVHGEVENHARALCEQALAATPNVTNDPQSYITRYTAAYTEAYETEVQVMDASEQREV